MLGKIIGAAIGAHIEKDDGGSEAEGAILGALAPTALRAAAGLAVLAGGLFLAKKLVDGLRDA